MDAIVPDGHNLTASPCNTVKVSIGGLSHRSIRMGVQGVCPARRDRQELAVHAVHCPGRYTTELTLEDHMSNSKQIAGLVGPTLVAMLVAEFPLVQPHLYDRQIPPVVYLSGVLMFVAGLAIVRAHSRWARDWTVLVTLSGWFLLVLGLIRMFAADTYQRSAASAGTSVFMVLEAILLFLALVMTFKAYSSSDP
jgi:hypothetical protein